MRQHLPRIEYVFTIFALVIYSGGLFPVILSGGFSEGEQIGPPEEYPLMKLLFAFTYLIFTGLLTIRWKKVLYVLSKDKYIVALIGLVWLSVFWSASPSMTLTRGIAFLGTNLFGLYIATRYTLRQQLELLGWAFGVILIFSYIYAIALPKYGVMSGVHEGAWRGIFTHKNTLGNLMTLSIAVFLILLSSFRKYRIFSILGLVLSVILLLLSTSVSPLVSLAVVLLVFFVCQSLRHHYHLMVISLSFIATGSIFIYVLLINSFDLLLESFGKDSTLTGRTDIWSLVVTKILERPWLGYGYEGFWQGWDSEAADIWNAYRWQVPNSHNGFLDILLQLGMLGFAIFIAGYFYYLSKMLLSLRNSRRPELIWPIIFFIYFLTINVTESVMMGRNDIAWVIYTSASLSLLMPEEETSTQRSIGFTSKRNGLKVEGQRQVL